MKISLKAIKDFFKKHNVSEKVDAESMSAEEWAKVTTAFKEEFAVDLQEGIDKAKAAEADAKKSAELQAQIDSVKELLAQNDEPSKPGSDDGAPAPKAEKENVDVVASIKSLQDQVKELGKKAEKDVPQKTKAAKSKTIALCGPGHTDKYLFGIELDIMSMERPWNKRAARLEKIASNYSKADTADLIGDFNQYAADFSQRVTELHNSGQMAALLADSIGYTDLESDLGAYYRVRRMDSIITYLKRLESVAKYFPVRYNVQDEEVIVSNFEGRSFTQAYQAGKIVSGKFDFQPDRAKVSDVMFKFKFENLKNLEREYIGYLNKEGSDPMKWSFIEWILVQCAIIQFNEKEKRRVKGIRIEPTTGEISHYMYASKGILENLDERAEAAKPSVYTMSDYNAYTRTTMYDYVYNFIRDFMRLTGKSPADFVLCVNAMDLPDFLEDYRSIFGTDLDFSGEKIEVKNFKLGGIIPVPHMGERKDMWLMPKNAIEIHEDAIGEFYNYYFEREMEVLYVASYGKEGTFSFAGRKYANKAAMIADRGRHTQIFRNLPATLLADGATSADAFDNEIFMTVENAGATVFTDFENAEEGVVYKLICGNLTNATTISKTNKFSELTAAWTPTAVGDYIKVIYDPDTSKFLEVERKVGGTLAANTGLTAPAYTE